MSAAQLDLFAPDVTPTQWAMEGAPVRGREPGRLYASFPVYATRDEVEAAADCVNRRRPDLPPVRILVRDSDVPGTSWRLVGEERAS